MTRKQKAGLFAWRFLEIGGGIVAPAALFVLSMSDGSYGFAAAWLTICLSQSGVMALRQSQVDAALSGVGLKFMTMMADAELTEIDDAQVATFPPGKVAKL